ncbi:MAG: hypothetical protein JXJ04_22830 [Spirochaetales bacterium]|nr:hypothetical protein [Spirochaetales bacterium]
MKKCFLIVFVLLFLIISFGFTSDLTIQYRDDGHGKVNDNYITPCLKIINKTSKSVALSELTIRYYYSKEGTSPESFHVKDRYPGRNRVTGTFYEGYLEIGFTSGAGSITPFGHSREIRLMFHKDDWSHYNEANDYSYKFHLTRYSDNDTITLYKNGILVWGREPCENIPVSSMTPIPAKPPGEDEPETISFIETDGMVVIEAEHYSKRFPGKYRAYFSFWREIASLAGSSNRSAMVAFPNRGINLGDATYGPGMEYNVNFRKTGTYYCWVRMWGPGLNDNSLHSGLDGIPASYGAKGMSSRGFGWKWVNKADSVVTFGVESQGYHAVTIWMREDGTWIDKILLTTDPFYVPQKAGPEESPREFPSIPESTPELTPEPTIEPTGEPTPGPTIEPTPGPTIEPTIEPTMRPTGEPTPGPTIEPTPEPTMMPTGEPTPGPTIVPTPGPTIISTDIPTVVPTIEPSADPTVEPTNVSTPVPATTDVPLPDPISLKVQYQCGVSSGLTNMIRPYINIVNTGETDVPLREVSLRYYYTKDGATDEEFMVDDAPFGGENVAGSLMPDFLQVDFKPEAGILSRQSETGGIICGILRSDGSPYDQWNDFSYDPAYVDGFADFTKITLFVNDSLLWGYEPDGPTPPPTAVPNESVFTGKN